MLMNELDDAHEHLGALISLMNGTDTLAEEDFKVQLAHVFSHLNRAWHRRNMTTDLDEDEWLAASRFPSDLDPI